VILVVLTMLKSHCLKSGSAERIAAAGFDGVGAGMENIRKAHS